MTLVNYCPNFSMKTIFVNTENGETNVPHKFVLNFLQRLELRSSNKHVDLQNLSIYYAWKNVKRHGMMS